MDEADSTNAVVVPRISCPLSDDDLLELKAEHSSLGQSDAFGIDIYIRVVSTFLKSWAVAQDSCNT